MNLQVALLSKKITIYNSYYAISHFLVGIYW